MVVQADREVQLVHLVPEVGLVKHLKRVAIFRFLPSRAVRGAVVSARNLAECQEVVHLDQCEAQCLNRVLVLEVAVRVVRTGKSAHLLDRLKDLATVGELAIDKLVVIFEARGKLLVLVEPILNAQHFVDTHDAAILRLIGAQEVQVHSTLGRVFSHPPIKLHQVGVLSLTYHALFQTDFNL